MSKIVSKRPAFGHSGIEPLDGQVYNYIPEVGGRYLKNRRRQ